jgi:hypothetical protein
MLIDVSGVHTASIIRALMMEAVSTCETSVKINLATRRYIPEDSKLYTRHRENLKSHKTRMVTSKYIKINYIGY